MLCQSTTRSSPMFQPALCHSSRRVHAPKVGDARSVAPRKPLPHALHTVRYRAEPQESPRCLRPSSSARNSRTALADRVRIRPLSQDSCVPCPQLHPKAYHHSPTAAVHPTLVAMPRTRSNPPIYQVTMYIVLFSTFPTLVLSFTPSAGCPSISFPTPTSFLSCGMGFTSA